MNILILGAGSVGATLAAQLSAEGNDITVVDNDALALQRLQDRLDIAIHFGHASEPNVLEKAGAEFSDMLIAVTQNDEVNIVACQIAHILFKIPRKIARLRQIGYLTHRELFDSSFSTYSLAINNIITPELLITNYIQRLIKHPGALQVEDFANGAVRLVVLKAHQKGKMVRHPIRELSNHLPSGHDARIMALYRQGEAIFPTGETVIEPGDEVFILAAPKSIKALLQEFGRMDYPYRKIMIAGGGHVGFRLAQVLEGEHEVKVIDKNLSQARNISETLTSSIVLHGDVTDENLLMEENIDETDLFIAVTESDNVNAISSIMAKHYGARKAIALLNNPVYSDVLHDANIDIAFSSEEITASSILGMVREGDTVKAQSLRRGAAEVLEIVVHGSENSSSLVDRTIGEIDWPADVNLGAIVRDDQVIIAHSHVKLEVEDHIVLFVRNRSQIPELTRIFSPQLNQKKRRSWF